MKPDLKQHPAIRDVVHWSNGGLREVKHFITVIELSMRPKIEPRPTILFLTQTNYKYYT